MAATSRAARIGRAVAELSRLLAAGGPAPRGLPCFGLESASGTAATLLDSLAGHGIFRKYELVLVLDDALGATGRWLASRLGCRAVSTATATDAAAAGLVLTRRAGLASQVLHLPATAAALPFRDAVFTHVWAVETLPELASPAPALREAYRVLRPGGHLAVQELVRPDRPSRPAGALPTPVTAAERAESLRDAGFDRVSVAEPAGPASERAARVVAARERFRSMLLGSDDPALRAEAAARDRLEAAVAAGTLLVVHGFGRRP